LQIISYDNVNLTYNSFGCLVLHELTPQQLALAQYMSELSEEAFCAGWMECLEFDLWKAVTSGPFLYGCLQLEADHIQKLSELSQHCGGWIVFDDEREELFLPMAEWLSRVVRNDAKG
jgi:hypothetical protein